MEQSTVIILIVLGFILILVTAYALAKSASNSDDDTRWRDLVIQMKDRYPNATYKAQIEFLRRDKYAALKIAIDKNEDIAQLSEEYALLTDEYERVESAISNLGGEFDPYVSSHHSKGVI